MHGVSGHVEHQALVGFFDAVTHGRPLFIHQTQGEATIGRSPAARLMRIARTLPCVRNHAGIDRLVVKWAGMFLIEVDAVATTIYTN